MWFLLCIVYAFTNSSLLFSFTKKLLFVLLVRGQLVSRSASAQDVINSW